MTVVLFWDIDGTLLTTARAGVFSLEHALEQVTGVRADLQGMATAGMTDYAIAAAAIEAAGQEADDATVMRFLDLHGAQLASYLGRRQGNVMPGVREVLEELDGEPGVVSLLLTGNIEAGARAKLAHYGLDAFFRQGGAFCVGAGDRVDVARRAAALTSAGDEIYVIGDTPADVECGHAIDARTIAVATGSFDVAALEARGPWCTLERLPAPPDFRRLVGLPARGRGDGAL
jgi:phosphoglycolate phosphatase-like HAD superfamily hydrolase